MREIRIERTLAARPEHVFELISDHPGYTRFQGVSKAELLREGEGEPHGLGAKRRISAGPIHFDEEITAFDRPNRMDYLIFHTNLPIRHEGGSIQMTPRGESTDVVWTSRFEATTPALRGVVEAVLAKSLDRSFNRMLSTIESASEPALT